MEENQKYWCPKCKVFFYAIPFQAYRTATGMPITHHCGEVAAITREGDFYHKKYPNAITEGERKKLKKVVM